MKLDTSAQWCPLAHEHLIPIGANRGQILIVDPDPLTQWALRMYLGKWFRVDTTDSFVTARRAIAGGAVVALIVSDELPPDEIAELQHNAREHNADVTLVRTVADPDKPPAPDEAATCLDKPFELAQLAHLLGVPENELPHE